MPMKTLQEDIDDLDRMVDTDAPKDAIRSQIRLISREVAQLETDYARLAEAHEKLQAEKAEVDAKLAKLEQQNIQSSLERVSERQRQSTRFTPRRQ